MMSHQNSPSWGGRSWWWCGLEYIAAYLWDIWVIMTVLFLERMFVSTSGLTSLAALSTVWGAFQKAQIDHRSKASNIGVMIKLAAANPGKYLPNIYWLPEKLSILWALIVTSLVVFSDAGKPQVNSWLLLSGLFCVTKRTCPRPRWQIPIKKIFRKSASPEESG